MEASPRPHVLLVGDDAAVALLVVEALASDHRITRARGAREGLEKARSLSPDLILTDADELVRETSLSAVPIVVITDTAEGERRARLLREGARDFVTRPFSAEELRARVSNLLAATRAERASRVKSSFLNMVSHELKTPVTALKLQLHLLEKEKGAPLTPRQSDLVKKMGTASSRLLDLIESLLEYARLERTELAARIETFDLNAVAREVVAEQREQAKDRGIALHFEPASLPAIASERRLVRLVLSNLVDNGVKFTAEGSVTLALAHGAEGHRVSVRDTGAGIPLAQRDEIFEPWRQLARDGGPQPRGFGLGLSLVREIAAALGGRIEVASVVGEGSTFSVVLPPPGGSRPVA